MTIRDLVSREDVLVDNGVEVGGQFSPIGFVAVVLGTFAFWGAVIAII
jgi:hypothetical protein